MQCEMCGADIKGPSKRIRIEGAELTVCSSCAKYGTEVHPPAAAAPRGAVKTSGSSPTISSAVRRPKDFFDQLGGEIVEDYAEIIRSSRMKMGLTQKDLALAMMEKELLIKKIEKGELIPEDAVRRKLEKVLQISLLENPDSDIQDTHHAKLTTTMGDVIKIKKSKK